MFTKHIGYTTYKDANEFYYPFFFVIKEFHCPDYEYVMPLLKGHVFLLPPYEGSVVDRFIVCLRVMCCTFYAAAAME